MSSGRRMSPGRRMIARPRARALGAVLLAAATVLPLSACSPLGPDPVPETMPEGERVCDGVARLSVERILGEGVTAHQTGDWRSLKETGFACYADSPAGVLDVVVTPFPEETAAAELASRVDAWRQAGEPIADPNGSPGQGYLAGEPGQVVTASWACTDRTVEVQLEDVWVDERRDQRVDAERLLVSVLGYACRKLEVPGVDYTAG